MEKTCGLKENVLSAAGFSSFRPTLVSWAMEDNWLDCRFSASSADDSASAGVEVDLEIAPVMPLTIAMGLTL